MRLKIILLTLLYIFSSQNTKIYAKEVNSEQLRYDISSFTNNPPDIQAKNFILMDINSKTIIYEKNSDKRFYPASITKVLTALIAIENKSLEDKILVSENAVFSIERGSSHIALKDGEVITYKDALFGLMLQSANDCANAIAEDISTTLSSFAEKMNERAKEIGAENSNFINAHGLHDKDHYTTAYDMALISIEAYKNDLYREIIKSEKHIIAETQKTDEERYIWQKHSMLIPSSKNYYEYAVGGKTGYTSDANHTLVTYAKKGDMELVVVILNDEENTKFEDTRLLFDYAFDNFKNIISECTNSVFIDDDELLVKSLFNQIVLTVPKNAKNEDIKNNIILFDSEIIKADSLIAKNEYYYKDKLLKLDNLYALSSYAKNTATINKAKIMDSNIFTKIAIAVFIFIIVLLNIVLIIRRKNRLSRLRKNRYKFR